jgi:C-terminal processing protease CtpA/Prc
MRQLSNKMNMNMKLEVFSTIFVLLVYLWTTTEAFTVPNTGRHLSISSSSHISESVQYSFRLFAENAAEVANETSNTTIVSSSSESSSTGDKYDDSSSLIVDHVKEAFPEGGEILTFEMVDHRPLGCTIEESLDKNDDYVFISRITPDGNADKAGLKVGDVVVGVTGLFGGLTIVMDSGVEKM